MKDEAYAIPIAFASKTAFNDRRFHQEGVGLPS